MLVFSAISVGYVGSDETLALYSVESFWYGIIVAVTLLLYTVVLLTYGVLMQLKLTSAQTRDGTVLILSSGSRFCVA